MIDKDKDDYDYCAHCDVEPPALKFKCPECEHNPDNENNFAKDINVPHKEQIMIDGVDVSGCLFYQSNFEEDYDVNIKHFCSNWHNSCKSANNSNCYFKQLARKTQECEELKKELETYSKMFDTPEFKIALTDVRTGERQVWRNLGNKAQRYEQALEEIEKVINNILNSCLGRNTVNCRPAHNVCGDLINILDIINKAKGV